MSVAPIYLTQMRAGKEVTYGTGVVATRRWYVTDPVLNAGQENAIFRFATGTPGNVRAVTQGKLQPSISFSTPVSSDELPELFGLTVRASQAGVTPATAVNTRDYTYTDGATVDSATVEWDDAARAWQAVGVRGTAIEISGSADGDNMLTFEGMASNITQQALTGTPTERVPVFHEGWETTVGIGAAGVDPTTLTAIAAFLQSWSIRFERASERKYLANNTRTAAAVVGGEITVSGSVTVEAAAAQALTEYTNYINATRRMTRLTFGNNATIETTFKKTVWLDLPLVWTGFELAGENAGSRMYTANFQGIYDATAAYLFRAIFRNDRASLW